MTGTEISQQSKSEDVEVFKPGWRFFAAFGTIGVVNLAAALDATTISVALPVCTFIPDSFP
jgi:hypothetical protein